MTTPTPPNRPTGPADQQAMPSAVADIRAERDQLAAEARSLLDRSGTTLTGQAAERYSVIETRLDQLRTAEPDAWAAAWSATPPPAVIASVPEGAAQFRAGQGLPPDPYGGEPERVPSLMPSRQQVAQMFAAVQNGQPLKLTTDASQRAEQNFAAVTVGGDAGTPAATLDDRVMAGPRRIADAARIVPQEVGGITQAVFPVFLAGTAGTAAEGAAKSEYSNINPGTATPQVINVFTDMTRQLGLTHLSFEGRLRQKLAALVAAREDLLLITKVLATTGIQVQAPTADPFAQQLLVAAAKVSASDVGQEPDLFAFNPADAGKIFGAAVANTPPAELARLDLQLYGMRGYPTTHVTVGTAVVGAWNASTRLVVGMPPQYLVDPYTQMKNNIITVLLEEAVDLAVDEPSGFVNVDLVV